MRLRKGKRKRRETDKWLTAITHNHMKYRLAGACANIEDAIQLVNDEGIIGVTGELKQARKHLRKILREWNIVTGLARERRF